MIPVKLERDEARAMETYFFDFIKQIIHYSKKIADSDNEKILQHLIGDQFEQIELLFKKKLLNKSNKLHFNFTDSQAIILYKFLFNFPIDSKEVWLQMLRQRFCNLLYDPVMKIINLEDIKLKQPVETG